MPVLIRADTNATGSAIHTYLERAIAPAEAGAFPAAGGLVYLVPAILAASHGRRWHSILFIVLAALTALDLGFSSEAFAELPRPLHQVPQIHARTGVHGLESDSGPPKTIVADLSLRALQLGVLQVCLLVLGPEDPFLRRVGESLPLDVVLWSRIVPVGFLLALQAFASSERARPGGSWMQDVPLVEVLLFSVCAAFWLSASGGRQAWAQDVLLRRRFWTRAFNCLVLPGAVMTVLALQGRAAVVVHLVGALAAAFALQVVCSGHAEVLDRSWENPLVVHWILFGGPLILFPAMGIVLALDAQAHSYWRWPTLSMSSTTPECALALRVAAPLLAAAALATLWVLGTIGAGQARATVSKQMISHASWRASSCRLGCLCGYASITSGALTALIPEASPLQNIFHVTFSVGFFASMLPCILLVTASSNLTTTLGAFRAAMAITVAGLMALLALQFIVVNQYIPNDHGWPHWAYAMTEYAILGITALLPTTWYEDVLGPRPALSARESSEGG